MFLYYNIFLHLIYSCHAKLNFQHHYFTGMSVTWSFRNNSCCSRNILLLLLLLSFISEMLKTVVLLWKLWYIFPRILWWNENSKEQHLFKIKKQYYILPDINIQTHLKWTDLWLLFGKKYNIIIQPCSL